MSNYSNDIIGLAACLFSLLILAGCGGGGGEDGASGETIRFTQYAAPEDPTLLTAETAAGERMAFYGEKDDEGIATTFRSLRFQTPEQVNNGSATWVHFDESGQVRRFEGENGSIIDFKQLSDTEYLVSAVTPDGEIQANTVVDTTQTAALRTIDNRRQARHAGDAAGPVREENLAPRGGRSIMLATDYSQAWQARQPGRSFQQTGDNTAPVTAIVTECNDGRGIDDAEVFFSAGAPGDALPPTYLGIEDGTRRYRASIPLGNEPLSAETVRDACLSSGNLLGLACDTSAGLRGAGAPVFCAAVAGGIDTLLGGPSGEGALIFTECQAGFFAVEGYCTANDTTPQRTADFICNNIADAVVSHPGVQSELDRNQLTVQAHANLPGRGSATSENVTLNPFTEEYPTFFVDYGGSIAIDELSTAPAAPEVGEDYVVTVQLACSTGTSVTVQIEGSDGYSDSAEFMPSNDEPLTVAVPGGRNSERDVIRVLAVSQEMGPFGFITAQRDTVVAFKGDVSEPPMDNGGGDGGGNGGDFDFSSIEMAQFDLDLTANGVFFPTGEQAQAASVPVAEMNSAPNFLDPQQRGCARTPSENGQGFIFTRDETTDGIRELVFIGGILDSADCLTIRELGLTLVREDVSTGDEFPRLELSAVNLPGSVVGSEVVYRLDGSDLCAAITDFDYLEDRSDGDFESEAASCDSTSSLEIRFQQ